MISNEVDQWTVLIVDDEPNNLTVAQKVLSFGGAEVHIAGNGIEGLAVLANIKPTFVLLDISMPEMDGWEMFERIRAKSEFADMPVIALTAHVMEGDRKRIEEASFNGYIAKPFRIKAFMEDIQSVIKTFNEQTRTD